MGEYRVHVAEIKVTRLKDKEIEFLIKNGGWGGINAEYCFVMSDSNPTIIKRHEKATFLRYSYL